MQVGGILETVLHVADVERSAAFYRCLFGFPALLESELLIAPDVSGRNMHLLFPEGGPKDPFSLLGGGVAIPTHSGSSGGYDFAFSTADRLRREALRRGCLDLARVFAGPDHPQG